MINNIKFYSLLLMCWFMAVWLVGVGTDNVKLAVIAGDVALYSWAVGMVCLIVECVGNTKVNKEHKK